MSDQKTKVGTTNAVGAAAATSADFRRCGAQAAGRRVAPDALDQGSTDSLFVDISGRIICPECAGAETISRCFLCDNAGFVDELGQVDAEDVARAA